MAVGNNEQFITETNLQTTSTLNEEIIPKLIKNGEISFFIGAAFSSLYSAGADTDTEEKICKLGARLSALKRSYGENSIERIFLTRFEEKYVLKSLFPYGCIRNPDSAFRCKRSDESCDGVSSECKFSAESNDNYQGEYRSDPNIFIFQKKMISMIAHLVENQKISWDHVDETEKQIIENLRHAASKNINNIINGIKDRNNISFRILEGIDYVFSKTISKGGDTVWLSDILFETLVFDLWLYPSASQLATELALMVKSNLRPPSLGYAGEEYTQNDDLRKNIKERFEKCAENFLNSHLVIALSLKTMCGTNKRGCPIAVTTNYDKGLEFALESIGCRYRVIYPLLREISPSKDDNNKLRKSYEIIWKARDWEPGNKETGNHPLNRYFFIKPDIGCIYERKKSGFSGEMGMVYPGGLPNGDLFSGPLIVKLHGSPLDSGNSDILFDPSVQEYDHNLVLSESSILENLRTSQISFPPWLKIAFSNTYRVLFMGYSLSDWNIRACLAHLPPYEEERLPPREKQIQSDTKVHQAIVYNSNRWEMNFYNRMGIITCDNHLYNILHRIVCDLDIIEGHEDRLSYLMRL